MDALALLEQAQADGVAIRVVEHDLEIEADETKRHWLAKLRPHKSEIVRLLNGEPGDGELPPAPRPTIQRFKPFPTDALPEPLRGFVSAGAKAIGCDASYIALPLLTALAAAIGNTRRIELKRGWSEPAILWTAIVGDSGTMKSPALELALRPVRERQRKALATYAELMASHRDEVLHYERDLASWKKGKGDVEPPAKPVEPVADRTWTDDPTVEALAVLLLNQSRGLLMIRDELAGWIGSFDRYAGGKGSDVTRWLEMFGGRPMVVDRKTGEPKTLYVPRAAVSVTGGIQPGVLARALNQQYRENGLAARLLLTCPPRTPKRWTEADIDPAAESEVASVFDQLYELAPRWLDDDTEPQPQLVRLAPEARRLWIEFYNAHAQEHAELSGDLSAAWSKLEGYAVRLALVVHLVRWAHGDLPADATSDDLVDAKSIAAGIDLSRWFGHEARRIYAMLQESDEDRERRQLFELIERKGGSATPRELMRSSRKWPRAEDAEADLEDLVRAGLGKWTTKAASEKGGRPTRVLELLVSADVDTTSPSPRRNGSSVNVNAASLPESEPDELYGEL